MFAGAELSAGGGILTLFNHTGFGAKPSGSGANWVHVPFEFSYAGRERRESGSGFVNLLIDKNIIKNTIDKSDKSGGNGNAGKNARLIVGFDFPAKKYLFALTFSRGACRKVLFRAEAEGAEKGADLTAERLAAFFARRFPRNAVPEIRRAAPDELSAFCGGAEPVSVVRGSV